LSGRSSTSEIINHSWPIRGGLVWARKSWWDNVWRSLSVTALAIFTKVISAIVCSFIFLHLSAGNIISSQLVAFLSSGMWRSSLIKSALKTAQLCKVADGNSCSFEYFLFLVKDSGTGIVEFFRVLYFYQDYSSKLVFCHKLQSQCQDVSWRLFQSIFRSFLGVSA